MRRAQKPQGRSARGRSTTRYVLAGGSFCAAAVCLSLALAAPAAAQNPTVIAPATNAMPNTLRQPTSPSAFPKAKNSLLGPIKKIDQTQPLYLQGDELVYDS